jgi:hypothetical protein
MSLRDNERKLDDLEKLESANVNAPGCHQCHAGQVLYLRQLLQICDLDQVASFYRNKGISASRD